MKYILFDKSAVEILINESRLQSLEYEMASEFIQSIKGELYYENDNIACIRTKQGVIFAGPKVSKEILFFDLNQCHFMNTTNDHEKLIILQKTFRFAIRFWNRQAFTNCEKIFKSKTVIFPFPYSLGSSNRIVIDRDTAVRRLGKRGITSVLLAYKYGEEGAAALEEEIPNTDILQKGGEEYVDQYNNLLDIIRNKKEHGQNESGQGVIQCIETENIHADSAFKYMNFDKQINLLTDSQKSIVKYESLETPIRIEGPAGTGKTAAMVLRALHIIKRENKLNKDSKVYFFTHSKSTQIAVKTMMINMIDDKVVTLQMISRIEVITLQEYCVNYIGLKDTQIIDLDAFEAKQYQLMLILDAFENVRNQAYSTYKYLLSEETKEYFETEDENKIVVMLQYEFSIHLKGVAEGDFEKYKIIEPLTNGIPCINESDKEFVYRIFNEYQTMLENQAIYDTDDIILEALARLNAPLWRRARIQEGIDYLFVDEMHLFNLNEQQIFHHLTKYPEQEKIPICFALDYAQVIGEIGNIYKNYIDNSFLSEQPFKQSFGTVFRSSQQIAELCASITASGALLFDKFVNPYRYCESNFTANEESICDIPKLYMYENDCMMKKSIENHIKEQIAKYKCKASDVAIIFFDEEMLKTEYTSKIGKYSVNHIDGKSNVDIKNEQTKVVCSLPEYINGLEYSCVILVGVDEGRVPQIGISDISSNFLKYGALNKLYLSCSRARFSVIMLGTNTRGVSSCLKHSIEKTSIVMGNIV